jgi:tetratricopeptide (TPR) repeat protein
MKCARNIFIAVFAIGLVVSGFCVTASTQQEQTTSISSDAILSDASLIKGIEAMHNLDFKKSHDRFEEVRRRFPDHPAPNYYLAANLFFQTLTQPNRLLPLLSNLSRSKTFGESNDKVDEATVQQFRTLTRQAIQLANARLKRDSRDAVALYFLGATHGLNAAFKGTLERSIVAAMREGSSGVDKHRDVMRLDPRFHDAELSIGLYEYTVGALPLPVKIMAALANVRGSKKRGLEALERVGREGHLSRHIAKLILITLYKREKQYAQAAERARELSASFPNSYLFRLAEADALVSHAAEHRRTGQTAAAATLEREAFTIFDSILSSEAKASVPPPPRELIHFVYGEALLKAGLATRAAQQFLSASSARGADSSIATIAVLRAAHAYDLAGSRREAVAQYGNILKRPDAFDSRKRAEEGLRRPYKE